MSTPEAEMLNFQVWGWIAANRLPERLEMPHLLIYRLNDPERLADEKKRSTPVPQHAQGGPPEMASIIPGDILVRSRWQLVFRLQARDDEAAVREVEDMHLPAVHAAVQAVNDDMINIKITRVGVVDENGWIAQPRAPWSWSAFVHNYRTETMGPEDTEKVALYTLTAGLDKTGLAAARQYTAARRLHDLNAGLQPLMDAALLGYFQVLELIARRVCPARGIDYSDAAVIMERMRKTLGGGKSIKNQVSALHDSSQQIKRMEFGYLRDQIHSAGEALGLEAEDLARVEQFCKLRNTQLGHPGRGQGNVIHPNFGEELARKFLAAYLGIAATKLLDGVKPHRSR